MILDGITIRGCSSTRRIDPKDDKCNDINECTLCKTNKCNGMVFPESRLHCLHCGGSSCVNQTNTIDVRHPCVNYRADDKCYSIFSHGNFTFCITRTTIVQFDWHFQMEVSHIEAAVRIQ